MNIMDGEISNLRRVPCTHFSDCAVIVNWIKISSANGFYAQKAFLLTNFWKNEGVKEKWLKCQDYIYEENPSDSTIQAFSDEEAETRLSEMFCSFKLEQMFSFVTNAFWDAKDSSRNWTLLMQTRTSGKWQWKMFTWPLRSHWQRSLRWNYGKKLSRNNGKLLLESWRYSIANLYLDSSLLWIRSRHFLEANVRTLSFSKNCWPSFGRW